MFRSCDSPARNLADARCPRIRNISLRKHSIGKYAQAPRSNRLTRNRRTLHVTAAIVNILTAEILQRRRESTFLRIECPLEKEADRETRI